jgi:hypothetical protein
MYLLVLKAKKEAVGSRSLRGAYFRESPSYILSCESLCTACRSCQERRGHGERSCDGWNLAFSLFLLLLLLGRRRRRRRRRSCSEGQERS